MQSGQVQVGQVLVRLHEWKNLKQITTDLGEFKLMSLQGNKLTEGPGVVDGCRGVGKEVGRGVGRGVI